MLIYSLCAAMRRQSLWPEAVEAALDKELGPRRPLYRVQPLYFRIHFLVHVVVNVSRTETGNKFFKEVLETQKQGCGSALI
jgi:hypothetical protein